MPVEHVVADVAAAAGAQRPRRRERDRAREPLARPDPAARRSRAPRVSCIVCPQSDPARERRIRTPSAGCARRSPSCARRASSHGQIAHPDPYAAAMEAIHDERVDEIIVSTFPGERSGWLRRDLVGRLRADAGLRSSTSWSRSAWRRLA